MPRVVLSVAALSLTACPDSDTGGTTDTGVTFTSTSDGTGADATATGDDSSSSSSSTDSSSSSGDGDGDSSSSGDGDSSSSGDGDSSSSGDGDSGDGDGGDGDSGDGDGGDGDGGDGDGDGDADCGGNGPCAVGLDCCDGVCVDVYANDPDNCGSCDACENAGNLQVNCEMGVCTNGDCIDGYFDCDGDSSNGCESNIVCACTPGETQNCYTGPANTEGVGACIGGTQTCLANGSAWGPCEGEVTPGLEICSNMIDEDCNGAEDDIPDIDGDGWNSCNNDCCETESQCSDPVLVNPGAFEFVGNGVDDDCDPGSSDDVAAPDCSLSAIFNAVSPTAMAQAIDLCQFTTANEPLPTRKWGVISAEFRRPDGSAPSGAQLTSMQNSQSAVLANYGNTITPQKGPTMGGISTGMMRDSNDPGFVNPNGGSNFGYTGNPPAPYLAANGGNLPASASCNGNCPAGSGANDPVNLRLTIRVPTNAESFSYQFRFFSAEYAEWTCDTYNDFYLALLTSGASGLPADKNISFDTNGNAVSVNNGFFDVCTPSGCYTCPAGNGELVGTGMDGTIGGGTSWLTTTAPVVPGETITLELMVFDVSDNAWDSLTILDAFEWSIDPSGVGTVPTPE